MAGGKHTFAKRRRELERQRKKKEKASRRAQRKVDKEDGGDEPAVDPDIAHIVPGPQAQPWMDVPARGEAADLLAEDEKKDEDDDQAGGAPSSDRSD